MFDEITYDKGASLLRMLEMYLSENTFQTGIQAYMKQHSFGNATTEDLWQALSQAAAVSEGGKSGKHKKGSAGPDVSALMQAWVHTPGCPLVSLKQLGNKKSRSGNRNTTVAFDQERLLLQDQTSKRVAAKEKAPVWQIPLVLKSDDRGRAKGLNRYLLTDASARVTLEDSDPVYLNGLGNGFFRSKYDNGQLAALAEKLKSDGDYLSPAERISLVSDLWSLAFAGRMSIDDYLAFTDHFCGDSDPYVQTVLVGQMAQLESLIGDDMRPGFQALVRSRLNPVLEKLTMSKRPDDTDLINDLRGQLILTLGTMGNDKRVIEYCRGQFETYLNDDKSLEGNLRAPIVDVVAYNGGEEEFNRIQTAYTESKEPEARQRNLEALSFFRERDLVERALGYSLSKEVRAQDITKFVVGPLLSNSASKHLAWEFVKEHWPDFAARLTEDQMPKLIDAVANFSSEKERSDISAFIATHPLPAGRRRVAKTLEFIAIRTQFKDKQSTSLAAFLKKLVVANSQN
jgi:aminopeptidase N